MNFPPISIDGLSGREEALSRITHYVHEITPVMYYKTNDLIHSRRVMWHLKDIIPQILEVYGDRFNTGFARTLALVHDDAEIINGDVQLNDKERMTKAQLDALAKKDTMAIPKMVEMYGTTANGFEYADLLTAAKEKDRLEAQLVSFCDKFDAAGEAWHEVWAGNKYFRSPAGGKNHYSGGYIRRIREFPVKYPTLKPFFETFANLLPQPYDFGTVVENGKPYISESLLKDIGYTPYERWKKRVMAREGIELLTKQVEFMK